MKLERLRRIRISRVLPAILARIPLGRGHYCVVCEHHPGAFLPYRQGGRGAPPLMSALGMVGSDIDHFECPWCSCHDRERHLLMYMRATGVLEGLRGKRVLHFAPERHLSRFIAEAGSARYIRCDLYPQSADIERVNMLDIAYADGSFDLVIANHVLEHVADDVRALSEIRRVLSPGGQAILQTPYCGRLLHTWADAGIDTDEARLQAYGQEDHVRLYGRDIFERFASTGLAPRIGTHEELLPKHDPKQLGVNAREPFMLFQRLD